jgi:hypothetical protein
MAQLEFETVNKLVELLSLPVTEREEEDRPISMASDIGRVSEELGSLVFEDSSWFEYDAGRIADILDPWLDDQTAAQFDSAARDSDFAGFLDWIENLIIELKSGETGAAGPATEDGAAGPLGIENPNFEPNRVPGTEYYKYQGNEYLYAATADAPEDQWKTLEAWYDDYAVTVGSATPDEGVLRGYPYTASVLPGTEYYVADGDDYLYGPHEVGSADEWKPYEYWQGLVDQERDDQELIDELDALIALIDSQIDAHL